jgi:EcsC protein family
MAQRGNGSNWSKAVNWAIDKAIDGGVPPLSSARDLAEEYRIDKSYDSDDARVRALIRWETTKNFTSGFITGLGGILTLPVNVPAALGAAWLIQSRLAAAIAIIYGHDISEDRVRTMVLLTLVGDAAINVLKDIGVKVGRKSFAQILEKIPGRVLIQINKQVGYRLMTKAGEEGIVNLTKAIPVAGGLVGGGFDAVFLSGCRQNRDENFSTTILNQ